jgi:hypothetical protein
VAAGCFHHHVNSLYKQWGIKESLRYNGDEWSTVCTSCSTPRTHWTGGWLGLRAILDVLENNKFLAPARIWTLDHLAHSLVTTLTMLSWLLLHHLVETKIIQPTSYNTTRSKGDYIIYLLIHPSFIRPNCNPCTITNEALSNSRNHGPRSTPQTIILCHSQTKFYYNHGNLITTVTKVYHTYGNWLTGVT